ncbi:hypothetical protein GJ496_007159 [Pomphorhynchus laevis]|nr:hypothetical protein GJ496_007159 [Pomphorhynchus laevis]
MPTIYENEVDSAKSKFITFSEEYSMYNKSLSEVDPNTDQPYDFIDTKYIERRQIILIILFCICVLTVFILTSFLFYYLIRGKNSYFKKNKKNRRTIGLKDRFKSKDFLKSSQCDFKSVTTGGAAERDYLIKNDEDDDFYVHKKNTLDDHFFMSTSTGSRLPPIPEANAPKQPQSPSGSNSSNSHSVSSCANYNQSENVSNLRESAILFPSLSTLKSSTNSIRKSISSSNNGSESPDFAKIDAQFKKQSHFSRQGLLTRNSLDTVIRNNRYTRNQDSPTAAAEIYENEYIQQQQRGHHRPSFRSSRSLSFIRSSADSGSERSVY